MKTALVQLCSGEDPQKNLSEALRLVAQAADAGAEFILTPEVSNCIAPSRSMQFEVLTTEANDPFLAQMRQVAKQREIWLLIGSLGLHSEDNTERLANRSFLISPDGLIVAKYDKIHMFDVDISKTESYRESDTYRAGNKAVLADTTFGKIGMTVCYDVRYPHLYRTLAQSGAQILTVPAAFAETTGKAHWEALLRARAIENGAYVIAPAQTGVHYVKNGRERRTYGHSLAVSPWGEVLVDGGTDVGVSYFELDISQVEKARRRVGSLVQDRAFEIKL
ncbi:carbon-nitrogen hydrolase family protein [Lentibacter algarum]|uniref:carbon-nitrogen hydrolase family protein n=1 Tax=Lentibacter algarum TaxID=576131 RepID=UPI001C07694A|nr:carbon-nitrogen hydrolase family protein [Lentibacter algarum]